MTEVPQCEIWVLQYKLTVRNCPMMRMERNEEFSSSALKECLALSCPTQQYQRIA